MRRIGRVYGYWPVRLRGGVPESRAAAAPEYNPVRKAPVAIGPEARRLIVGLRATPTNAVTKTMSSARRARSYTVTQAQTTPADVQALAQRVGLASRRSRQFTPSMHVLFLPKTALRRRRGGGARETARRSGGGNLPPSTSAATRSLAAERSLVPANARPASGQWYMNTPGPADRGEGVATTGLVGDRRGFRLGHHHGQRRRRDRRCR